jgi:hypothetical protein
MQETWGPRTAAALLQQLVEYFVAEARTADRWDTWAMRSAAALAVLAPAPLAAAQIAALLRDAPAREFYAGALSNVSDLSGLVRRELPTMEAATKMFPAYGPNTLPECVLIAHDLHIEAVRDGQIGHAVSLAQTDLKLDDVAATCAVMGHIEVCLDIAERRLDARCRQTMFLIAAVESYRHGDPARAQQLIDKFDAAFHSHHWARSSLIAGLLLRVPWGGYPYADY